MTDYRNIIEFIEGDDLTGWNESASPGSHLFLICKNGEEHRGEIALRRMGLEIRDCIRWFLNDGERNTHYSVVIGRKPLEGTVAQNVLKYRTGAINIDANRVGTESITINQFDDGMKPFGNGAGHTYSSKTTSGRWPANVLHDGSEGVSEKFPITTSGKVKEDKQKYQGESTTTFLRGRSTMLIQHGDSGSASRFFHTASSIEELKTLLHRLTNLGET